MRTRIHCFLAVLIALVLLAPIGAHAQNITPAGVTPVQVANPLYYLTPISATAAVNTQVTLTIPAPSPNLFNYVCYLKFMVVQDGTSTAHTLAVTTATNFNSFALKYSLAATANLTLSLDALPPVPPGGSCYKSTLAGTATTFVSPAGAANSSYVWLGGYYQAP